MRGLVWALVATTFVAQAALAEDENPADQSVARKDRGEQLGAERTAHTETRLDDSSEKRASLETAVYADSDNVTVFTPSLAASITNVLQGASLRGQYVVDVVSAASADVVSTASPRWTEVRHAGSLEATYKPRTFGITLAGSLSSEPDYFSFGVGTEMTLDLNEKNTTLEAGFGFGHDDVGRCGAESSAAATPNNCTSFGVFSRVVNRTSFNLGITQILGKATTGVLVADIGLESGDQSKPYRYVPMFSSDVAASAPNGASFAWVTANRLPERPLEQTPLSKRRVAVTGRLAHRFEGSTLRLEERVYGDTWALFASTTDARWIIDLGKRVALWPHARFHGQSAVSFWKRAYVSGAAPGWDLPVFRTGDRELGPLWTVTGGGGLYFYLGGASDPQKARLSVQVDGMYTSFLDDLYISSRSGLISSLTLEVEL
ncbi:MAG TPA: DUF3570 domain-containing protein [Polyangiaceae bacterium]|jgi:hypothetical protein